MRINHTLRTLLVSLLAMASLSAVANEARPRLVVQITIDGLRGAMPLAMEHRFQPTGLGYLLDQGTVYTQANYQQGATFTAVGHATLFTGGCSPDHGIAGNNWWNRETGREVYCVEDPDHTLIGVTTEEHAGTSPRNLESTTIGDELVMATGGASRVFGVSIKDRGAILPAGARGKAFWYHGDSGRFVTSKYYYPAYPAWVDAWNGASHNTRYHEDTWTLLRPQWEYAARDWDERAGEINVKGLGTTFPHRMADVAAKDRDSVLRYTPYGDELTLNFARELITRERLGQVNTDMLCLSLSCMDYVNHAFGPFSLESEDLLLRIDLMLSDFFAFLDREIGLENTLIVFSADHGFGGVPEHAMEQHMPAGRVDTHEMIARANRVLRKEFGLSSDPVASFLNPSFYLNPAVLSGKDEGRMQARLAELALETPGISVACTRTDLLAGRVPPSDAAVALSKAFHPRRSGDVMVAAAPGWYLYHSDSAYGAMHGSPHRYDTHVPLLFAGPGIAAQRIHRPVAVNDIASTLALRLGVTEPSGCTGMVLEEVIGGGR